MEEVIQAEVQWRPSESIKSASNLTAFLKQVGVATYEELNTRSEKDPEWFWNAFLKFINFRFYKPYTKVMDSSRGAPWTKWCLGGETNVVLNCLDKHRGTPVWNKTYIIWEGEDGRKRTLTYAEFNELVCKMAGSLKSLGIGKGDVVGLYVPMIPEAIASIFAVTKIGGILMPLFSGFGPEPLSVRFNDSSAKAVITVDGTWRRGKELSVKGPLDEALKSSPSVKHVIVVRHLGDKVPANMVKGRDHWFDEISKNQPADFPTVVMDAEDPAFLVYTSGTTGKPKGTVHTHCSLAAKIALDVGLCMDMKESDRLFWMSDIGWLVGPLASISSTFHGASFVVFEGAPDYPDTGRHWRAMSENKVTYLGIAPTSVRSLMRYGNEIDNYDFSSLRIMVSTGEPWTFDAWKWLFERVGKKRVPILNYTGGTECGGGIAAGTVLHPLKPGCFAGAIPGTGARVVDENGKPVSPGTVGELVMTTPSIGNTRSLWHDDERYIDSYYSMYGDKWRQGDFAMIDADGFWYLLGRSDDTIKVSGKRTGPSEIEGILTGTGKIVEAAVIGLPDPIKGSAVGCVCVPMPGVTADEALRAELSNAVTGKMGVSYRPKEIIFVSDLPKTRNLKIMRRMVRSVILGDPAGDTSSLVNPESLEELRGKISR